MITFENSNVFNIVNAVQGARNSWGSNHKSDSDVTTDTLGDEDLKLAMKLAKAGASHAKFMRQILVNVNINAPLYWWKQFDQYKVGTTTNSESTMHTINRVGFYDEENKLNLDMFSFDYNFVDELGKRLDCYYDDEIEDQFYEVFRLLERTRVRYNETKDKRFWDLLIALLPSGFNQMRTTTMNYAVLANIYHDRKNHKLDEWKVMCEWIETLPYSEIITGKVE